MSHLIRTLLIGVLLCVIPPSLALAQDSCTARIIDETGRIGGANRTEEAIQNLINEGAEPYVRIVNSFGSAGSLDRYVEQTVQRCANWQGMSGGWKSNLILIFVAMDTRDVGMYAGESWRSELHRRTERIQGREIAPRLRDGDFDLAVASGFDAARTEIQRAGQPSEPVDLSGLWNVLGWIVAIGTGFFIIFFVWRAINKWQTNKRARDAARQRAKAAYAQCTRLIKNVGDAFILFRSRLSQSEFLSDARKSELAQETNKFEGIHKSASAEFGGVRSDPNDTRLGTAELDELHKQLISIKDQLSKAEHFLQREGDSLKQLQQTAEALDARTQSMASEIAGIEELYTVRVDEGYTITRVSEWIVNAKAGFVEIETLREAREFEEASSRANRISEETESHLDFLKKLPILKEELLERLKPAVEKFAQADKAILRTKDVFEVLEATYSEACYESVIGNGTEAINHLDAAVELYEKMQTALEEGNFDAEPSVNISRIYEYLRESLLLAMEIENLEKQLSQAVADVPNEISLAAADIAAAEDFIESHQTDVSASHERSLEQARSLLQRAKTALTQEKPNYLAVIRFAKSANSKADEILENAQAEHERAERLRTRAISSLNEAASAVKSADGYIRAHGYDVSSIAKRKLKDASSTLEDARAAHENGRTQQTIRIAEDALALARNARRRAKRDFSDAESERRRKRYASSTYVSTSSSWGKRRSGFGSSSSFGSGGFGSSSSFGGGGGGFGSSSKF